MNSKTEDILTFRSMEHTDSQGKVQSWAYFK